MTIKLHIRVEPVDETAEVAVTREREGEEEFHSHFQIISGIDSPPIDVEIGDRLAVAVAPARAIVLDDEQFCVRLEDPNTGALKEKRDEEKRKKKEDEEYLKAEHEARAKEAKRLKDQYNKEAKETEVPVKQVPFPAPLPEEYDEMKEKEKAKKQAEAAVPLEKKGSEHGVRPPKGGAMDSKEVKGK